MRYQTRLIKGKEEIQDRFQVDLDVLMGIETLNKKGSFKDVTQNRCLIIADGFYE